MVCRDFLAPKHIDPKFLDPKYAFKELTAPTLDPETGMSSVNAHANVFMPEKKRRQRDGYTEGDYTLHKTMSASDFIRCLDPVAFLGSVNRIMFSSDEEKECVNLLSCKCEFPCSSSADGLHCRSRRLM